MICSNKHKCIEKVPQCVPIRTFLRVVQEAGYVLGQIVTKTATTPRVSSWSVLKTKLAVLEMQTHPKNP